MEYVHLLKEEIELWEHCLSKSSEKISLNNLEKIFHCNSYFADIAGREEDQFVTQSTLIALHHNQLYYYISVLEHLSILDFVPKIYEVTTETFSTKEALFSYLGNDWEHTKKNILHYNLHEVLEENPSMYRKNKI